ncbi:MAG: right-handed parallel beta-helix repeat-containing protein, partial [Gemmatimonadaceae bacterium]|nr:right-handed parallel beta-helix repeat-containing protein [Gemmatimonadaceae bacterium]
MSGTYTGATQVGGYFHAAWNRFGSSSNPVTLQAAPGATPVLQWGIAVGNDGTGGSYLRIKGLDISGHDGVKCYPGSHHVDIDGCNIHNTNYQGVLIGGGGSSADNIQVWNTRLYDIGGGGVPDQHGVYIQTGSNITLGNLLIYNVHTYGIQFESGPTSNVVITHCTISAESRAPYGGPMVFSWGSGTNVRVQGCLMTHSDVAGGNEA